LHFADGRHFCVILDLCSLFKAAVDGTYHTTPLVRRDLMRLAEAVAQADGTLSRVGKNMMFGRLVKKYKAEKG